MVGVSLEIGKLPHTQMTDPISDFLIRLKNASMSGRLSVSVPFSNMKFAIANLLSKKGFVGPVARKGRKNAKFLEVVLLYENGKSRIANVTIISKPSRRLYGKAKEIRPYRQGFGMSVFSTPMGILSDMDAKKENVGGEILFKIW